MKKTIKKTKPANAKQTKSRRETIASSPATSKHPRTEPKRDSGGMNVGLTSPELDIAARKEAERSLREGDQRFRSLIENASDLIVILNADYTIAYASPSVVRILGYTVAAVVGARITDFIDPQDLPDFIAATEHRARTPGPSPFPKQVRVRHADGSWRILEGMGNNLLDQPGVSGLVINARDITERKREEESVRRAEQRYRELFEDAPVMYVITRNVGGAPVIADCNQLFWRTLGYPYEEMVGRSLADLYSSSSRAEMLEGGGYRRALAGEFLAEERELQTRDGRILPCVVRVVPEVDAAGHISGTRAMYVDITERKRAEAALRASEEQYRLLFENANDIVYTHDLAGNFTSLNKMGERVSGYTHDEALQLNIAQVVVPEHMERIRQALSPAGIGKGLTIHELEIITKDGRRVPLELSTQLVFQGGKPIAVHGIARDITERKRAEETLRESENRLRIIVEGTQALLMSMDANGHFTYANDATVRAVGYANPEELIGKAYLHFVHPEDRQRVLDTFINQFNTRQPSSMLEFRITDTEGKVKWFSFLSTLAIQDGHVVSQSGVAQDITERKRAEEALAASEAELRALFASMHDAVLVIDREGIYREIAPTNPAFWYIPPQELLGKRLQDVFSAEQSEVFYGVIHQVLDTKQTTQIEYALIVGNQVVWYEASISPMSADSTLWVARDITERKRAEEEISRRNAELAALYQIGQAFNQLIQPNEILERIYSILGQVLDNRNLYIALFDEVNQSISFPVYTMDGVLRQDTPSRPVRNGLTEYVLHTKTPLLISRDLEASLAERGIDSVGRPSRCYLATPILTGRKALGVIAVQDYEREDAFHENDLELLVTVASQTATALEKARLFEETRRRADEFVALYDITRDLAAQQDVDALLNVIVQRATDLLVAPSGTICLYDPARDDLVVAAIKGSELSVGTRIKIGEGAAGIVAQTRAPLIVADYSQWEHRLPQYAENQFGAAAAVPILYAGTLIGTLNVLEAASSARKFTDADARLLSLFAGQAAGAVRNARLHEETARQLDRLEALHNIDIAITASMDLQMTLNILLEHAKTQLNADATSVLLLNPHSQTLEYAAGRGFRTRSAQTAHIRLGEDFAGRAALERRAVQADDPAQIQKSPHLAALWAGEGFAAYYGVPLIAKGEVKGVLEVFHRAPFHPESDWISFLETLAGQAAIAIESAQLFENLQRSNVDLALAYNATIEGWSRALDLRDEETEGHTQRVTEMTLRLARLMGIDDAELVHVRRGALLHDMGKMGVPDSILFKPDPLTDDEWRVMRLHPQLAYDMLSPISYLRPALDIPYCHHEKWDGSGYPRGLKGEQIPLVARIFAIVDVWDALTSDRVYRPAWSREKVIEHIKAGSGSYFDPKVVEAFLQVLE